MADTKKMTKKDYFAQLRTMVEGNAELTAFIDHEVELLDKKSSKTTMTATQKENEGIKATILTVLSETNHPMTVSELMTDERLPYSNQRISALLTLMGENGTKQVVRTVDKKKAYFTVA